MRLVHRWLYLIIIGYFIIGLFYVTTNPLWESPDELHHFAMIRHLHANGFQLPSQEPSTVGLWQQEGNQPPLYYYLAGLLTVGIDTNNTEILMRINPHADVGFLRPDGNVNRIVHAPTERFPSWGAGLATYLVRMFSLCLGAGTIATTFAIVRRAIPDQPIIAIFATGFSAFVPMFIYITASVNNDNLSNLIAHLLLLQLIILSERETIPYNKDFLVLGLLVGIGLLSKLSIGFMIPVVIVVLASICLKHRSWMLFIRSGVISGGVTILIAGWWYWRNWHLFGDPSGLSRFLEIVGVRANPADIGQILTEHESFSRTFWGMFGSINILMIPDKYMLLNVFAVFGLISGVIFIVYRGLWKRPSIFLPIIWLIITSIGFLRWTSITPATQGRLMYGAMVAIVLLISLGWLSWLPKLTQRIVTFSIISCLFIFATIQPFVAIAPAYHIPDAIPIVTPRAMFQYETDQFIVGESTIRDTTVYPNSYVILDIDLKLPQQTMRNWSIFVHVVNEVGILIAQRDVFPMGGLMATSDYVGGYGWNNQIAILIPQTTYSPTQAEIRIGFYDVATGVRMMREDLTDYYGVGSIQIESRAESTIPNLMFINFDNQIALLGYDLSRLTAQPDETIELTLYWQALRPIQNDYVVFANIIDPMTLTKFAASNAMPVSWTRPTSSWQVGEIIVDRHTLSLFTDAIVGEFPIEVGLYLQQDGNPRLPILGTYDNLVYLSPIRILNRED